MQYNVLPYQIAINSMPRTKRTQATGKILAQTRWFEMFQQFYTKKKTNNELKWSAYKCSEKSTPYSSMFEWSLTISVNECWSCSCSPIRLWLQPFAVYFVAISFICGTIVDKSSTHAPIYVHIPLKNVIMIKMHII